MSEPREKITVWKSRDGKTSVVWDFTQIEDCAQLDDERESYIRRRNEQVERAVNEKQVNNNK